MSRFAIRGLAARLRIGDRLGTCTRLALRVLPRGQHALWIGTGFLLLVLAGALQLRWMSQANQSRMLAAQDSLARSVRLVVEDLEFKVWLLLELFRPDADAELAAAEKYYRQRFYMWHELSQHGPLIKRILVYDTSAGKAGGLREMTSLLEAGSFDAVPWSEDLVQVRQYIEEHGFRHGRGLKARWTGTWVFHPGAMALLRPIAVDAPSSRRKLEWPAVSGYLILKLDPAYARDRWIPDTLNRLFGRGPLGSAYTIDFVVDGDCLIRYESTGISETGESYATPSALSYLPSRLDEAEVDSPAATPDQRTALMFSPHDIPDSVRQELGAVQRIWVQRLTDSWRSHPRSIAERGPLWSTPWNSAIRGMDLAEVLRRESGLPRLYAVGDKRYKVHLEARHVGLPLAEALNREHLRSLAMVTFALVLLLGASASALVGRALVARSAELKTDAAASLAHQLLTPITAIIFIGEYMGRGILGRHGKAIEYGGLIHRYGKRLQTIVDRAMQMSAMKKFERRFDLVALDASKVAENAIDDLRFMIEDSGFTVECALATDLPKVRADLEALQQAVSDLIGNAVKYGLPGRWLKVETVLAFAGSGREVQIRVHDRGPGIPARDASRIFEPYYRIDNRITKSRPGAGLGLKLAVEMVKGMGGTVTLESEEGQGSVFTIHLPVPSS